MQITNSDNQGSGSGYFPPPAGMKPKGLLPISSIGKTENQNS
jgi:hypothetical protein